MQTKKSDHLIYPNKLTKHSEEARKEEKKLKRLKKEQKRPNQRRRKQLRLKRPNKRMTCLVMTLTMPQLNLLPKSQKRRKRRKRNQLQSQSLFSTLRFTKKPLISRSYLRRLSRSTLKASSGTKSPRSYPLLLA